MIRLVLLTTSKAESVLISLPKQDDRRKFRYRRNWVIIRLLNLDTMIRNRKDLVREFLISTLLVRKSPPTKPGRVADTLPLLSLFDVACLKTVKQRTYIRILSKLRIGQSKKNRPFRPTHRKRYVLPLRSQEKKVANESLHITWLASTLDRKSYRSIISTLTYMEFMKLYAVRPKVRKWLIRWPLSLHARSTLFLTFFNWIILISLFGTKACPLIRRNLMGIKIPKGDP